LKKSDRSWSFFKKTGQYRKKKEDLFAPHEPAQWGGEKRRRVSGGGAREIGRNVG